MGATKQGINLIGSENEFIDSADMSLSKFGEIVKVREARMPHSLESQRVRHDLVIEQQKSRS